MSTQPIPKVSTPQSLPSPDATPNQPGDGKQQAQPPPYSSLPGPTGTYYQPPVISAPPPYKLPFTISTKKARALFAMGIAQVMSGILSIVCNGVGYYVHTTFTADGPGFWAGVPVSVMQYISMT